MSGGKQNLKYNDEMQRKADEYLDAWASGDGWQDDAMPSNTRLSRVLGVTRQTLDNWASEFDDFRYVMDAIKAEQKLVVQNKGLRKEYDSTLSKLVLATNHGMSDKQSITHGGTVGHVAYSPEDYQKAQAELSKHLGDE